MTPDVPIPEELSRAWWLVLLRGALAVLLGLISFYGANAMVGRLGLSLALVFLLACLGVYLVVAASVEIWLAIWTIHRRHWWMYFAHPAVLLGVAVWLLTSTASNLTLFTWLATLHAALAGMILVVTGVHLRSLGLRNEVFGIAGVLSWLTALAVQLLRTSPHGVAVVLGIYALLLGAFLIFVALHLRKQASPVGGSAERAQANPFLD